MKILHIIPSLSRGGAERFVVNLCNILCVREEVFLISLFSNDDDSYLPDLSSKVHYSTLGKKKGVDVSVFLKLSKLLREIQPDVVNTHLNALEYIFPFALRKKYHFFHTVHNEAPIEAGSSLRLALRKRLFSRRFVCPITISRNSQQSFVETYRLENVDRLIFNGASRLAHSTSTDIRRHFLQGKMGSLFVNVARINPQKNQVNLVKAFNLFNKRCSNKHVLLIIGDVQSPEIANEIMSIKTEGVHVLGGVKNVGDYYAAADVFILPSLYEGLPVSLLEAMSFGCLPICTPVGGVVDVVSSGENGLLSQSPDVDDIFDSLYQYEDMSEGERERMEVAVRKSYEDNFSMEHCAQGYVDMYRRYVEI